MPRFHFEAANATGQTQTGSMEAESTRAVRLQLRDRGLTALDVREVSAGTNLSWLSPALSAADLCWATRELASLLGASLPLEGALSATIEQAEATLAGPFQQSVLEHRAGRARERVSS